MKHKIKELAKRARRRVVAVALVRLGTTLTLPHKQDRTQET